MEITHLKLSDMYEALARDCNIFEGQKEGSCFAESSNLGCPFGAEDGETVKCGGILPRHWRLVFECGQEQEPEPLPPFQFGDKVTAMLPSPCEAIFNAYVEYHGFIRASVLFEGSECCEEVAVCDLKAGWDG